MQFFFAPAWGKLSDRIGRRPVMLISNLGAAGSYALFAVACTFSGTPGLWMILVSRIFAGICGANLSVASAYIADISPPEKRSARMGLIGMAFGLGFIFGPAIGAFSVELFGRQGPGRRQFLRREFYSRLVHPRRKPSTQFRQSRSAPEIHAMGTYACATQTRIAHLRFLFRNVLLHLF
jgi:MFS family permease